MIGKKNPALFEELNHKLKHWDYEPLAEWLFENGFKSLWSDAADPIGACVASLTRYRGGHWRDWLSEEAQRGERFKTNERLYNEAKESARFATSDARKGTIVQAKTIGMEALDRLLKSDADPKDISFLLRGVIAAVAAEQAEETLSDKQKSKVKAGLDAMRSQARKNPKLLALIEEMGAILKGGVQ